jgi:hypothetical protein
MSNAQDILKSLDASELREKLGQLTAEQKAVKVLLRAASRLERQQHLSLDNSQRPATEGGTR